MFSWVLNVKRNIGFSQIRWLSLSIAEILNLEPCNQDVKVMGWLISNRKYKKLNFLHINDGSTAQRLQVVVPKSVHSCSVTYHAGVCVEGKLVASHGLKQSMEVVADKVTVLSNGAPVDYPFVEKLDYLNEDLRLVPHFRPRTKEYSSLLRVRSQAKESIRTYFRDENFVNINTPILTTNDCEGGGEVFAVKGAGAIKGYAQDVEVGNAVFGRPVYLTVSGQLHLEAMASGISKVYNFNPAFRGEKGSTMHLHEFWMVEMEEAFLHGRNGYDALLDRIESFLKFTLKHIVENAEEDVYLLRKFHTNNELEFEKDFKFLDKPFIRLKFSEALKILNENKEELGMEQISDDDLNRKSELFLTKYFGLVPIFVTDWPSSSKPFYMYREGKNEQEIAFGVDLLLPGLGEVASGGLREHRFDELQNRVQDMGQKENLKWYLDLRNIGYAPSGGFGLGFERYLQFLTRIDNIKDTIPFPRSNGQCNC